MILTVFSHEVCDLGEGPLWSPKRKSLFWVDINRHLVFEKAISSNSKHYDSRWEIPAIPSALALVSSEADSLWVITDKGLLKLHLTSGEPELALTFQLREGLRTNDAGVGPDGNLWIGTMECHPQGKEGSILTVSPNGRITQLAGCIGIPNTFCWSKSGKMFYISDSMERTLFYLPFPEGMNSFEKVVRLQSDNIQSTFDGGAIDENDHLWIACWGGGYIARIDETGQTQAKYSVPAQQPTSCCFGGENSNLLFITSAVEGLSDSQKQKMPDAGKVFIIETESQSLFIPSFQLT
ncbi:SMP-30/gluconolactonase/LRE family protein [Saccharospirillum impatiens]|uniref:SMP-30/gluconolactonase/LRE family protein n=1 Tax=Saccharospirillum impatiens TaxID=169438 RepID=UPI000401561F|nr:SMP-30/gluconolactonase/LRE family protein [Saccharospirillum impatiens]